MARLAFRGTGGALALALLLVGHLQIAAEAQTGSPTSAGSNTCPGAGCKLRDDVRPSCAGFAEQSACKGDQCRWLSVANMTSMAANGLPPVDGVLPAVYAPLLNLTAAAAACSSLLTSATCPTSCQAFLAQLPVTLDFLASPTITTTVCGINTCNANNQCWETEGQMAAKLLFTLVLQKCTKQSANNQGCFAAGGRCVVADVCGSLNETACSNALLPGSSTKACRFVSASTACPSSGSGSGSGGSGSGSPSSPPANRSPSPSPSPSSPPNRSGSPPESSGSPSPSPSPPSNATSPPSNSTANAPSPYDPCASSTDPCCRRSSSFSACVLDSPPSDQCSYSGNCQADYSRCSSQTTGDACRAQEDAGCIWYSYWSDNSTGGYAPSPSPAPSNGSLPPSNSSWGASPPGPPSEWGGAWAPGPNTSTNGSMPGLSAWKVPQLSPDYFNSPDRWWNQPGHYGHGPFDLLTPRLANALLAANVTAPLCQLVREVLLAASSNMSSVCEASSICTGHGNANGPPPVLDTVLAALGLSVDPCAGCHRLFEQFAPILTSGEVGGILRFLVGASNGSALDAASGACPAALGGVLWVATYYDFLPSLGQPLAAAVCPAIVSVVNASGADVASSLRTTCADLGNGDACNTLAALLSSPAAAESVCYMGLPMLLDGNGPRPQPPSNPGSPWSPGETSSSGDAYFFSPQYLQDPKAWWNQPNHHGHGPFDLTTPPTAASWIQKGASRPVCEALGSLLDALAQNATTACADLDACSEDGTRKLDSFLMSLSPPTTACEACPAVVGGLSTLVQQASGLSLQELLRAAGNARLLEAVTGMCPSVLPAALRLALRPDHISLQEVASFACPLGQTAITTYPQLSYVQPYVAQACQALGVCDSQQGPCVCTAIFDALASNSSSDCFGRFMSAVGMSPGAWNGSNSNGGMPPNTTPWPPAGDGGSSADAYYSSPQYLDNPNAWWNQPSHRGHGPFDLITPPVATAWIQKNASEPVCESVGLLLNALAQNGSRACTQLLPTCPVESRLDPLLSLLSPPTTACRGCPAVVEALSGVVQQASGLSLQTLLQAASSSRLLDAVSGVCPSAFDAALRLALRPDHLSPQDVASAACPIAQRAIATYPQLAVVRPYLATACQALGACDSQQGPCICTAIFDALASNSSSDCFGRFMSAVGAPPSSMPSKPTAPPANGTNTTAVAMGVLRSLHVMATSLSVGSGANNSDGTNSTSGPQFPAPSGGYCTVSPSRSSQCYSAYGADRCSSAQGCRWSASCYQQNCSSGDSWCLNNAAARPICVALVKATLNKQPVSAAWATEACKSLKMCGNSTTVSGQRKCSLCQSQVAQAIQSVARAFSQPQSWGTPEEQAMSSCGGTLQNVFSSTGMCDGFAALTPQEVAAQPNLTCATYNSTLCYQDWSMGGNGTRNCSFCTGLMLVHRDLAAISIFPNGSDGLASLCYAVSQYSGMGEEQLANTLSWQYGCQSQDASCCTPLPSNAYMRNNSLYNISAIASQSDEDCASKPGCSVNSGCYPAGDVDPCNRLNNATACATGKGCLWQGWGGNYGQCSNPDLHAKCRLAGFTGGKSACLAIVDANGLAQCNYNQGCYPDWNSCTTATASAVSVNSTNSTSLSNTTSPANGTSSTNTTRPAPQPTCCMTPRELAAANASRTCLSRSSGYNDWGCEWRVDCVQKYDVCQAFLSPQLCEANNTGCYWRPSSGPGFTGSCATIRSFCSDYADDAKACAADARCKPWPRCQTSSCDPQDTCCPLRTPSRCSASPGCATQGWCGMAFSRCWGAQSAAYCSSANGCVWRTSRGSAWCEVATDPCSPWGKNASACAAVLDPKLKAPICQYQMYCQDMCATCKGCLNSTQQIAQWRISGEGANLTALSLAKEVRNICMQGANDTYTCDRAFAIAASHPEVIQRPAAVCRALGYCSNECIGQYMNLTLCSTDGYATGAVAAATLPQGVCNGTAGCPSGQTCDTFSTCTPLTRCDPQTGFDTTTCGGTCRSKCDLQAAMLAELNRGTCTSDSDCNTDAGETCSPIAGRSCKRSSCNSSTGAITSATCAGFCTPGSPPTLTSARLSNDGRQIVLTFDQDVTASSSNASTAFAPSTAAKLGRLSQVFQPAGTTQGLTVLLDFSSTVAPGDTLEVGSSSTVVSRLGARMCRPGSVTLLAPTAPQAPVAAIGGPSSVGAACDVSSASAITIFASSSPASSGRALTFAWSVVSAASSLPALQSAAADATSRNSPRLVVPASVAAALAPGAYTVQLTVSNWLGASSSSQWTFTKEAASLPLVSISGGTQQTFSLAAGINIQTSIVLASVCPGRTVSYFWQETSGVLPAGSFGTNRSELVVKTLPGVFGGDALNFTFTATLAGAGSTTANLTLTALSSPVMAVVDGPRGDVLDTQDLLFSGVGSKDPDDKTNRLPFRFSWTCTATDPATQITAPCFTDASTAPAMTGSRLTIPAGSLPAGDNVYTVTLVAAKTAGGRTRDDSDTASFRVLAVEAPTGQINRTCRGAAGCTSKFHTPTEPLRLTMVLDDSALLPNTSFVWSSADVDLSAASRTTREQNLVILPTTSSGLPVFSDGATITISVTATTNGKTASATTSVPIARRPACTAADGACLAVSPASGPTDTTSFVAAASGFAADSTLSFSFGLLVADGRQDVFQRGSAEPTFTFAPRMLPAGDHTVFVCASDLNGAQACSAANITVDPASQPVSAADLSAIGDSLDTALAAGSTSDVVSAVRQLSSATANSTDGDQAAQEEATHQAESAMGALDDILNGDGSDGGLSWEDALDLATAAQSLFDSSPGTTPDLADSSLNIVNGTLLALLASGDPLTGEDLQAIIDLLSAAGPALIGSSPGSLAPAPAPAAVPAPPLGRRRLMSVASDAQDAQDALDRMFDSVLVAQDALLASMIAGEVQSSGTGDLVAAAAIVNLLSLSPSAETPLAIGASGATVTLLPGFATLLPQADVPPQGATSARFWLAHYTDLTLLLGSTTASLAAAPAAPTRRLLVAGPEVTGAMSTTVVSGYVNYTSNLAGAGGVPGQAVDVALPLNGDYAPGQLTMCLRRVVGPGGPVWRSDGIALASVSSGTAHCTLANLDNQAVVVAQYVPPPPSPPPPPNPPSPSPPPPNPPPPSPSPTPPPPPSPSPPPPPPKAGSSPPPPPPTKASPPPPPPASSSPPPPVEGGAGPVSSPPPPPAPSPPPPPAGPLVSLTVPTVSFTARLTAFTPDNFTTAARQEYVSALQASSPDVSMIVQISNVRAGSVIVDTTVQYLVPDGNSDAASALAAALVLNPGSLLPAGTFGSVTVNGVMQSTASVTVPAAIVHGPSSGTDKTAALIGGIVGGVGGALLASLILLLAWKRNARARRAANMPPQMGEPLAGM